MARFQITLIAVAAAAVLVSWTALAEEPAPQIGAPVSPLIAGDRAGPAQTAAPWQDVITGQIEAFRSRDADIAFGYAGASFQNSFPSAGAFFRTIVSSGYAPIMESRSHTFGDFTVDAAGVLQMVRLVGPSQELYIALYQLAVEKDGWRVQGVQLTRRPGVGI